MTSICSAARWPAARISLSEWQQGRQRLRRVEAQVDDASGDGLRAGTTAWGFQWRGRTVGLSWSWREVLPNVVALADPMHIASNAVLLDDDGRELHDARRVLILNAAIFNLPWQLEFRRALPEYRSVA
jgi:hypothetical protein